MGVLRGSLAKVSVAMTAAVKAVKIGALAMAASIGVGVWQAVKFEKQMAMVSTMLDEAGMKKMPEFAAGIRRLAVEFGESTETLSKGMYDILSASVAPEKAMGVLATAAKAAIGGFTSTAVAADAITTVLNSYGMSADQATVISDKMFATVKRGKLTYEELAGSIGKASATAAIAGLSLDELLASVSTITRAGIRSDIAMTGVIGTLQSFMKPSDDGAKLARQLGFELSTATLKAEGLAGVFKRLNGLTAEQLATLFPNIRGLKGVAAAMQDQAGFAKDLAMMVNSAGMAEEAFGKASDTTAFQLSRLKEGLLEVVRTVGDALLPVVRRLADWVTGLSGRFKELLEWLRPVGEALESLWAAMERAFNISDLWETVKGAIAKAATAVRDFLVYTVATVTTLVERWRVAWDTMKMAAELAMRTIWEEVKFTFTERIPYAAKWMVENITEILKQLGVIAAKIYLSYVQSWWNALKMMGEIAKDMFFEMWEWFKEGAKIAFRAVLSAFELYVKALKKVWGMIWDPKATAKMIGEGIANAYKALTSGSKTKKVKLFGDYAFDVVIPDLKKEMARLKEIAAGFEMPGRVLTDREKELYQGILDNIKALTSEIRVQAERAIRGEPTVGGVGPKPPPVPELTKGVKEAVASIKVKAELDRGSWSGLAEVWKNIQSAIMGKDPNLAEAKEQTRVLKDIRDGIDELDVAGEMTVGAGGT